MKTNSFFTVKSNCYYSLIAMISLIFTSCGSFKNSSYYDTDGIYGGSEIKRVAVSQETQPNKYKDYFSSLQNTNDNNQVFTDVEKYSTDTINNKTTTPVSNYSGWGNNTDHVTINVYDTNWCYGGWNNYWYANTWNYGWGWNNWYGPSYGWGWNSWYGPSYGYYGWGWNNYYNGYYGNYYGYGYNQNHSYSNGIRGYYPYNGGHSGYNGVYSSGRNYSNSYSQGRRNETVNNVRGYSNTNYSSNPTRNSIQFGNSNTRNTSEPVRIYAPTRSDNSTPRNYTPTRVESYSTPRTTYSNSSYSSPSSSGGRTSSGGSYGGGSYGGGRSSGGGGGGRR